MGNTRDGSTREDWQAHTPIGAQLTGRRKMREKEREGRVLTREQATVEATLTCNIRNKPKKHRRNLFPDEVEIINLLEA